MLSLSIYWPHYANLILVQVSEMGNLAQLPQTGSQQTHNGGRTFQHKVSPAVIKLGAERHHITEERQMVQTVHILCHITGRLWDLRKPTAICPYNPQPPSSTLAHMYAHWTSSCNGFKIISRIKITNLEETYIINTNRRNRKNTNKGKKQKKPEKQKQRNKERQQGPLSYVSKCLTYKMNSPCFGCASLPHSTLNLQCPNFLGPPHKQLYFSSLHQHPCPLLSCLTHHGAPIPLPARVLPPADIIWCTTVSHLLELHTSILTLGLTVQKISRSNMETRTPDNRSWG